MRQIIVDDLKGHVIEFETDASHYANAPLRGRFIVREKRGNQAEIGTCDTFEQAVTIADRAAAAEIKEIRRDTLSIRALFRDRSGFGYRSGAAPELFKDIAAGVIHGMHASRGTLLCKQAKDAHDPTFFIDHPVVLDLLTKSNELRRELALIEKALEPFRINDRHHLEGDAEKYNATVKRIQQEVAASREAADKFDPLSLTKKSPTRGTAGEAR